MENHRKKLPGKFDLVDNSQRCFPAVERPAANKDSLLKVIVESIPLSDDEIADRTVYLFVMCICIQKVGRSMNIL